MFDVARLLGGRSPDEFLRKHWQKHPLLIRGAIPDFREPLTPDELAGLSCEAEVESRLVCRTRTKFRVDYGPLEEERFRTLDDRNWTLLVQEVNRFVPEAAHLLDAFSFVPNWRVDDLMVSYAVKGGGVGPHVDSYDVFLLQGRGTRRWRYHEKKTVHVTFRPNLPLRILEHFEPDAEHVLLPGDMLYLPPGFAHDGVAESECTTYSIGFRSPNRAELTSAILCSQATEEALGDLYADPELRDDHEPGLLTEQARARVRAMVRRLDLSDRAIDRAFARFASQLKPDHTLVSPPRRLSVETVRRRWCKGDALVRSEEAKFVYFEDRRNARLRFFCAGQEWELIGPCAEFARCVSSHRLVNASLLPQRVARAGSVSALIAEWIALGMLAFA